MLFHICFVLFLTIAFQARGEAEATLALMTSDGVPVRVDAILTDDSDAFVFGATDVLRMFVTYMLCI
jgi:hypothetical protein